MAAVVSTLIELDENGVAWISDTKVKVIEVAIDRLAHGSSPEEMHFQYPHLSLAQIYAALAYYYEHQGEFDAEIMRQGEQRHGLSRRKTHRDASGCGSVACCHECGLILRRACAKRVVTEGLRLR